MLVGCHRSASAGGSLRVWCLDPQTTGSSATRDTKCRSLPGPRVQSRPSNVVLGSGFRVFGFKVSGLGFRVWGLRV